MDTNDEAPAKLIPDKICCCKPDLLPWDHLGGRTALSNRRRGCPTLEQRRRCTTVSRTRRCRTGRRLWSVSFAAAYPAKVDNKFSIMLKMMRLLWVTICHTKHIGLSSALPIFQCHLPHGMELSDINK